MVASGRVRIYPNNDFAHPFEFNALVYQFPCTLTKNDSDFTLTWVAVGAVEVGYLSSFSLPIPLCLPVSLSLSTSKL